ncbi:caspase family protein [Nitrospira sp. Nam80]
MTRSAETSLSFLLLAGLLAATVAVGCTKRVDLPDMGQPLPYSVKLELAPSVTDAKFEYMDNCGHFRPIRVGADLEEVLIEAAHRLFTRVDIGTAVTQGPPTDLVIRIDLVDSAFQIHMDNQYDRPPAEVRFSGVEKIYDATGKLLREPEIQVSRRERVRIEPMQRNCEYILDPFLPNAMTEFALRFAAETRSTLVPSDQAVSPAQAAPPVSAASPVPAPATTADRSPLPSGLSFKATVLDENSDLVFEGGERLRVHLDIVNGGTQAFSNVSASLTGHEMLLAQFPATTLPVGRLEPGESKSLDFVATLPQSIRAQQAELKVTVVDGTTRAASPEQNLPVTLRSTGLVLGDVDDVPAASAFRQPHNYVISVGLSAYRDQGLPARKYASQDAEMMATYFKSLGGVPASNIRVLQDSKALRPDIEEALLDWLPSRVTRDSTVMFYFAGQALVTPTGDTFLIPYEGSLTATTRLYSLKDLEAALTRLKVRQTLFIFDGSVLKPEADRQGKSPSPQWQVSNGSLIRLIGTTGTGKSFESDKLRHGIYTYYLLRGLRGEADTDRNGEVTIRELTLYVNDKVLPAARASFHQDQRPQVIPALRAGDRSADTVLTKPPIRAATSLP